MGTTELGARNSEAASGKHAGPSPSWRNPRWLWPAGFVAVGLVLFAAYVPESRTIPVMSDGASNGLQAWDMLHGNWLLHGWTLSRVSFYTVELPEYALVEAVHGLNAGSAHIVSALTYVLVVIGAAILAKGSAGGREGIVRAVVAGGIMVAPPVATGTVTTVLSNPDHVGTTIPLLVAWLIVDRARPRWFIPVIVTAVLALAQVADQVATYEGALPLAVVCAFRLYQRRDVLPGKWRESWYELALGAGSVVSIGVAAFAVRLIHSAGGYTIWPNTTLLAPVDSLYSHLWVTLRSVLVIFGADFSGDRLNMQGAIALLHLVGVALAGWALARALRRFTSSELLVQVLAVAAVVLLLAYTLNGNPDVSNGTHEINGLLPIGAILAGRVLAGDLITGRHLTVLGAVFACYLLVLAQGVTKPAPYDPNVRLANFLQAHHLNYGLATYWNASVVTLDSGGQVQVVPIVRPPGTNQIAAIRWNDEASWYDPHLHDARFLVLPGPHYSCATGSPSQYVATARATFGPPVATYQANGMTILVWDHNLLDNVFPAVGLC
jgi:hypothetical protein